MYLPFADAATIRSRFGGEAVPPLGHGFEPGQRTAPAPLFLSDAAENRRPHEPACSRLAAKSCPGRKPEPQINSRSYSCTSRRRKFSFAVESMSAQPNWWSPSKTRAAEALQRSFPNRASGHQALILWLQNRGPRIRVCLEATGLYSLDVALALQAAAGIEVAVLNPKRVNRFAATLCRSKTDPADAQVLAEYARRMPFQPWHRRKRPLWSCAPSRATSPPSPSSIPSRAIASTPLPRPPPAHAGCSKIEALAARSATPHRKDASRRPGRDRADAELRPRFALCRARPASPRSAL